jgi:hypothetical protein
MLAVVTGQSALRTQLQIAFNGLLNPVRNYSLESVMSALVRIPLLFDILNELAWTSAAAGLAVISTYWAKRGVRIERIVG